MVRWGRRIGEKPKHLRQKQIKFYWYCRGGRNILYFITTLRTNSFRWKDLKKALRLIPFESESKRTLSRLAAQRICETKILRVTLTVRGVRDTLKCEPGKKEVWTPNVVQISELREVESCVWFRRLWRSVSQRRMPRETEKYEIFQPMQCWFQMQRRQWKRNERRSQRRHTKTKGKESPL